MVSDELGKQLHDRATCGEELSEPEKEQLAAWYAAQDAAESIVLALPENSEPGTDLREQVAAILQQLTTVTQTIQALAKENATLRSEIAALRQQVAQHLSLEPV